MMIQTNCERRKKLKFLACLVIGPQTTKCQEHTLSSQSELHGVVSLEMT
jgi:hypothetical protein